jgi:hypothetical protein
VVLDGIHTCSSWIAKYKTNKYGMPLLNIIGVDACQRSFCIAFAFLSGENEEDYIWALGRL